MAADEPILIEDPLTLLVLLEQHPTARVSLRACDKFSTWYCPEHEEFAGWLRFVHKGDTRALYLVINPPDIKCCCCSGRLRAPRRLR